MGMGTRFDDHFPSHKTGMLKPDLECFDNVVRELDIAPDRILFLDDNEVNVLAAREAGLKAEQVWVPSKSSNDWKTGSVADLKVSITTMNFTARTTDDFLAHWNDTRNFLLGPELIEFDLALPCAEEIIDILPEGWRQPRSVPASRG